MSGTPKSHVAPTELNGFGLPSYRHVAPTALAQWFSWRYTDAPADEVPVPARIIGEPKSFRGQRLIPRRLWQKIELA